MMLTERISLTEESATAVAEYAFVISSDRSSAIVIAFGVLSGAIASSIDDAVAVVRG